MLELEHVGEECLGAVLEFRRGDHPRDLRLERGVLMDGPADGRLQQLGVRRRVPQQEGNARGFGIAVQTILTRVRRIGFGLFDAEQEFRIDQQARNRQPQAFVVVGDARRRVGCDLQATRDLRLRQRPAEQTLAVTLDDRARASIVFGFRIGGCAADELQRASSHPTTCAATDLASEKYCSNPDVVIDS